MKSRGRFELRVCKHSNQKYISHRICYQIVTFVQSFVGHAMDVAGAVLGEQPLHDHVHTGLPVRAPHAPTEGETGISTF